MSQTCWSFATHGYVHHQGYCFQHRSLAVIPATKKHVHYLNLSWWLLDIRSFGKKTYTLFGSWKIQYEKYKNSHYIIYIIWIFGYKNTFLYFCWWPLALATDSFHAAGSSCGRGSHDGCDFITPDRRPVKESVEDIDHGTVNSSILESWWITTRPGKLT